ncbi:ABC transporter substrate-binding protein [Allofournierella sp.]|uniref:ABC transporter substrate-binding protein n=1 Tax=Allofournierella sp. TaxID=1940256 RepID=UPI003AB1EBA5
MKKVLAMILSAALAAALLAGCGQGGAPAPAGSGQPEAPAAGKTLNVWLPPLSANQDDKEVWDKIMDPFEEEHGVTVNVEIVPWGNYEEKYLTGITSGQGPDVGYMYMEMITDFIDMGAVEPLDEYLTDADKDNLLYLANGVIRGKQYCLPIVVGNACVMCYNKDILEANGITEIPSTWDEFIETCKQIKVDASGGAGVYPFVQRWGNPSISTLNASFYPYVWQNGGQLFNEQGTAMTIDSEAGRAAVQFLYDLRFTHGILPDIVTSLTEDDCISYFSEGKAAFVEMETTNTANFDAAGVNWGFITSLTGQTKGTFVASDSLVLMSGAEDKALAYQLIQHMLSGPSMTQYHQSAKFAPIGKDEDYHDNPAFESVYAEDGAALHSLPAVKGSSKIYDTLYKNLQLMMMGEMKPDDVISETVAYAGTILNE